MGGMTPLTVEQMHIDQILLLICDKRRLEGKPVTVTGTPEELHAMGLLDELPAMSYAKLVRKQLAERAR